jgi:hypothetical protein
LSFPLPDSGRRSSVFLSQAVLRAAYHHERVSAMTQNQLERELADMTGESLATIRSRGFSLVEVPDLEPLHLDWDEVQQVEQPRLTLPKWGRVRQAA